MAQSSTSSIGMPVSGFSIQCDSRAAKPAPCVVSVITWPQMSLTRARRRR